MKARLVVRFSMLLAVALLCLGFGVYSFFRLNAVGERHDFNLYSLVPQDAIAVLETGRMAALVDDINALPCSKDDHFLYVSDIFVYLKDHLHTFVDDTPHGLSSQMNKMLISFHEPDTPQNQIFYCTLGNDDLDMVESFVTKYCSSTFPSRFIDYKGEEIRIYPMPEERFLAVYVAKDFLVASFQKRLVERVIDAYRGRQALADDADFTQIHSDKHSRADATLYVRLQQVEMGKNTDKTSAHFELGSWTEFDLKLNHEAIYCSGLNHVADTTHLLLQAMKNVEPTEEVVGELLPASTFFSAQWTLAEWHPLLTFVTSQSTYSQPMDTIIRQQDDEMIAYLEKHTFPDAVACQFVPKDTLNKLPGAVISLPLRNRAMAERDLRRWLRQNSWDEGYDCRPDFQHFAPYYPTGRQLRHYLLPHNQLFSQLTGVNHPCYYTYACFYRNRLLLAPDSRSLLAYVEALEAGDTLSSTPLYEELSRHLSATVGFSLVADMEQLMPLPEEYVRLIPRFFFKQSSFFRHFVLAVQLTVADGQLSPNIVLLYKPRS